MLFGFLPLRPVEKFAHEHREQQFAFSVDELVIAPELPERVESAAGREVLIRDQPFGNRYGKNVRPAPKGAGTETFIS